MSTLNGQTCPHGHMKITVDRTELGEGWVEDVGGHTDRKHPVYPDQECPLCASEKWRSGPYRVESKSPHDKVADGEHRCSPGCAHIAPNGDRGIQKS